MPNRMLDFAKQIWTTEISKTKKKNCRMRAGEVAGIALWSL